MCVGYTKIESANTKNLDDRSRTLVHLGTERGSKAYMMLDPLLKKIVVSRTSYLMRIKGGSGETSIMKRLRSQERLKSVLENMAIKA